LLTQLGSALWSSASRVSRLGVRIGILKPVRLDARVVSVGNIQAGGAGKTPLVAQIANEGAQRGLRIWILTRGYRGKRERLGGVIPPLSFSSQGDDLVSALEWGDEAALLHELCPEAWLGVGGNRVEQYQRLIEKVGRSPDLVILDDGFQNHQIVKDVEIVALTSAQWSRVFFRDSWSELQAADLLVWTKGPVLPEFSQWQSQKPWARIQFELPLASAPSGSYWLFTGIAGSEAAYQLALQSGYHLVRHTSLEDHVQYDAENVRSYLLQAEKLGIRIALTGKDWVKWRALGVSPERVTVLEPKITWVEGRESWERVVWAV